MTREKKSIWNIGFTSHRQSQELESSTALFLSRKQVSTEVYSSSPTSTTETATLMENELKPEEIKGFVTCMYNEEWWVACVLQVSEDSEQVRVSFLHPHGPSRSFKYPARLDILTIPVGDVLTRVDPRTAKGCTCTLTCIKGNASCNRETSFMEY